MKKEEAVKLLKKSKQMCDKIMIGDHIGQTGVVTHIDYPNPAAWDGGEKYYPPIGYFGSIHYRSDNGLHSADPHRIKKVGVTWEVE